MTFTENWKNCFKKSFITTGRATRNEFWMFVLPLVAFLIIYTVIILWITPEYIRPSDYLPVKVIRVLSELLLAPYWFAFYAVTVRRLQDSDHSGWAMLWLLLPLAGWIFLLYLLCKKGSECSNAYGEVVSY